MGDMREVEIKAGRRPKDGAVSLSAFLPGVLSVSVVRGAEPASTVQLTREQVRQLRLAFAELEMLIASESPSAARRDAVQLQEGELAA